MKIIRQRKIVNLIKANGIVKVSALAKTFQVTPETIRTDLNELARRGIIMRCHGGAWVEIEALGETAKREFINYMQSENQMNQQKSKESAMMNKVCVMGSFNVDMISYLSRLPETGESLLARKFLFSPGGKGCNQALAASSAGSQVHFITKIGCDQFSDFAVNFISSSKIATSAIYKSEQHQTGTASIFVNEQSGQNVIAIFPGANMAISADEVRLQADRVTHSDIVLLQMETNISALHEIMMIARKNRVPVILNPAPYDEKLNKIIEYVDYLTPNETEASLISGIDVLDIGSAQYAAREIYSKGVKQVVITLGEKGSVAYNGNNFIYSPVYPAVVRNTAGAGDAFNGALAASLAKGRSFSAALHYASAFSSLAVETKNASEMPDDNSVLHRMKLATYQQTCTTANTFLPHH